MKPNATAWLKLSNDADILRYLVTILLLINIAVFLISYSQLIVYYVNMEVYQTI